MSYLLPLSLATMLLLTGCLPSPKPQVHEKLSAYQNIKTACTQNPPEALKSECTQFLTDLSEENTILDAMQAIHEDERQEADYIALAGKESLLTQKLAADKALLAKQCQTAMNSIIKENDLNSAAFCLLFDENPITLEQYLYLNAHAPKFDDNPQYRSYEAKYAQKKIQEGIQAMSKGDKKSALVAFKAASDAKSAEAAYLVGIIYEEKQIEKAIIWHKKALDQGVNLSKINLARLYLRIKLPNKAREYYLSAAHDGNALAQYRLFKMDAKSTSLKAREEAQSWLRQSADNNYPQAQYIYGLQLLKQKKNEEAQLWLEKAHANGIADANLFLGKIYFEQEAYEKALPLLSNAQDKGAANYMLAVIYDKGLSVQQNSVLAYQYYKTAHELAHGNYVDDMKRVQKSMTPKARKDAQYIEKKLVAKNSEYAKACGQPFSDQNAKVTNRKIHITGVAVKPVKNAEAFVVYGDNEKIYIVSDASMAAKITDYTSVNFNAKATGNSVTISSDAGTLQQVYQFYGPKNCAQ